MDDRGSEGEGVPSSLTILLDDNPVVYPANTRSTLVCEVCRLVHIKTNLAKKSDNKKVFVQPDATQREGHSSTLLAVETLFQD